jgi:hypothetical protein
MPLVFLLVGCAVKLAPDYDKSIIEALVSANTDTLTLFAELSEGGDPGDYSEREKTYNSLIGRFDSLRVQAEARPIPRPLIAEWLGFGTTSAETSEDAMNIPRLEGPSADILSEIVSTLQRMRDTDAKGTLWATKVEGFKGSYEISFAQVLTYEKALER